MPPIERPAYRPSASPVSTVGVQTRFTDLPTPAQAPVRAAPVMDNLPAPANRGPSALQQLGDALSSLNSKIAPTLDQYFSEQKKDDAVEAELRAARDNLTSWGDALRKDPTLADKSPYFRQIYEARAGQNAIQKKAGELLSEYHSSGIARSTNPSDIDDWLRDRMKGTLDALPTPAAKAAAMEEFGRVGRQFREQHRQNSVGNLQEANKQSISVQLQTKMDNSYANPPVPHETPDPAAKDLKPHERGLIGAIGGTGGGSYETKRGKDGSTSTLDVNGRPGIGDDDERLGRYGIRRGAWREVMGDAPLTRENQDAAALKLARKRYKDLTGKDLDGALQSESLSPEVQRILSSEFDGLTKDQPRTLATFNRGVLRGGGTPTGPGAANAHVPSLMEEVRKIEATARAQGVDAGKVVLDAVTQAMIRHKDPTLAQVAMQDRADGTPGVGRTVAGSEALKVARQAIDEGRIKADNHAHTVIERQKKARIEDLEQRIAVAMAEDAAAGRTPVVPKTLLTEAVKIDASFAERIGKLQKQVTSVNGIDDEHAVGHLTFRLHRGTATDSDVLDGRASGVIGSQETMTRLLGLAAQNRREDVLSKAPIRTALSDIEKLIGKPSGMPNLFSNPTQVAQAQSYFREGVIAFKRENPAAGEFELEEKSRELRDKIVRMYDPKVAEKMDGYRPEVVGGKTSGRLTPTTATGQPPAVPPQSKTSSDAMARTVDAFTKSKAPGAVTAPTPSADGPDYSAAPPAAGVDLKTKRVFGSREELEREVKDFKDGKTVGNRFGLWAARNGLLKGPNPNKAIDDFAADQRKMLTAGEGVPAR